MPSIPMAWRPWPRRRRSPGAIRGGVFDQERRVVREPRRRGDLACAQTIAQRWRHQLVIDAPADVLGARRAAVAPPGVVLALRMQRAIRIDPAAVAIAQSVEPIAFGRQAAGI